MVIKIELSSLYHKCGEIISWKIELFPFSQLVKSTFVQ
jgi:hypothetical protein